MKSIIFLLILCAIILFPLLLKESFKFDKIIYQPSLKRFGKDFDPQIRNAKEFSEEIINSYLKELKTNVQPSFKDSFTLWKSENISARVLLSTFHESLIYIYPDNKNELIVDCTNLPVQMTLFYDLMNLQNPKYALYDHLIKINMPHEQAVIEYLKLPSKVIVAGSSSGYFFGHGRGALILENPSKFIHFNKDSFMTFAYLNIEIKRNINDPSHVAIYKTEKPHNFTIPVKGILTITGETNLAHLTNVAKEIGVNLAKSKIQNLISSSPFFRQSLAHKELGSIAEEILKKKDRSEKEQNPSLYPLWEYNKDIFELKQKALKFGVETSYIDNLLTDKAFHPQSGHLLWYYPNLSQFTIQWSVINIFLLVCIVLLKYKLPWIIKLLPGEEKKMPLLAIITSINSWVFIHQKPDPLYGIYWIIPGIFYLICVIGVLILDWNRDKSSPL